MEVEQELHIDVEVLAYIGKEEEFFARYQDKIIVVDPILSGYIEEHEAASFIGEMKLSGAWDELGKCFIVTNAEYIN